MINYYDFIENYFDIKNKQGKVVPFLLWKTQDKYFIDLIKHYGGELQGIRDIILKARKEGMSSFILALFATDFILSNDPIVSVCIADNKEETKKLFDRAQFFINSYLVKKELKWDDLCSVTNANEIKNKRNGAAFWIGTAGSKVAPRVESVQNLHFSEAAHFPNTDIINARETIEGALQMVDLRIGKVFIESTAKGYGTYYQNLWAKAEAGLSKFRPVFFGASELYSPEWLEEKRKEFTTNEMFLQEYPETPDQAFMSSGSKFFNTEAIQWLKKDIIREPLMTGNLDIYGNIL